MSKNYCPPQVKKDYKYLQCRDTRAISDAPKVLEYMTKKMEQTNAKKSFEKMTNLLGLTKAEYLAVQSFE